jgi:hypothetical protein
MVFVWHITTNENFTEMGMRLFLFRVILLLFNMLNYLLSLLLTVQIR